MANQDSNSDNKRRHERVESNLPVQYKNLKKTQVAAITSLSRNISEGGVCFKSNEFISLACRLVVEISLPAIPKPIKAISKIAWIRKLPSGDAYEIGNQFLEITKEDRARVTEFINDVLKPNI